MRLYNLGVNIPNCMEILRTQYLSHIARALKSHPVACILGERQVGKTTLARQYTKTVKSEVHYFDLENYDDLETLGKAPQRQLEQLKGLIVIDEIQRIEGLFRLLRYLVDRSDAQQQYLILGSASEALLKQSSESLAGRIAYVDVAPLSYSETKDLSTLWLRGGLPKSFLAEDDADSFYWRESYIRPLSKLV